MIGNIPAQTTANIVIASANRLMEFRQLCLKSSRMAEISVPAWPIPIHQTKLMIAKPQATGCVMAQIPVPLRKSHVTATIRTPAIELATMNPPNQPRGVCGVSTMREIFSVIDLKVCPGAMTRVFPSCRVDHRIIHGNVFGCHAQSNLLAVLGRVLIVCASASSGFGLMTPAV